MQYDAIFGFKCISVIWKHELAKILLGKRTSKRSVITWLMESSLRVTNDGEMGKTLLLIESWSLRIALAGLILKLPGLISR